MKTKKDRNAKIKYSGFWLRFIASCIDSLLWLPVTFLMQRIVYSSQLSLISGVIISAALCTIIDAVYEIFLTYKYGGTVGKLLLGIKVVDAKNKNITLGRSIGRYFAKYVSGLILGIGFLMIAWDKKKQGLHDKIVESYVINSNNKWQKRRKYVVTIAIIIIVGYFTYSMYIGTRDMIYNVKYTLHQIDETNPVPDILIYCGNQTGYSKDACYNYYASKTQYFKFENLSTQIDMCNKIHSNKENYACVLMLSIEKSNTSICNNSRSKYFSNMCAKTARLSSKIVSSLLQEYDLSGYNESLKADSITFGYVNNDYCIANNLSVYNYGDIICIIPVNVTSLQLGKDWKHWIGITADVFSSDSSEPVREIYSIFNQNDHMYFTDNAYNGYYSYFNSTDIIPGEYTMNFTFYDLIGKQKINLIRNFTILKHADYGNLTLRTDFLGIDYSNNICTPHESTFDKYTRICLLPKVSGFQKLPDELYMYNMDIEVVNTTGDKYYYEKDIFNSEKHVLIDSILNGPYAIVYTNGYPAGNYSYILTVRDLVSRKSVIVNETVTIRD